jgi:tetratricopeptide (TPR) repeat protein
MPSHIFVRRGLWDESISSNIASAEKARAYVAKTAPGSASFDELHAVDYLVYSYLQKGDVDAAKKLVDLTLGVKKIDNPSHFAGAYAISAVPGRWALERRAWKEAAAIRLPTTINWEKVPYAEANIHFSRGIGAARAGNLTIAREALARLVAIRQALVEQKSAYWADQVEIQRLSVEAWIAWGVDKRDDALTLQRAAADLESSTEKHPVTPGAIIPARELLAEMLLESGKREEASKEIQQVLHDAPNRKNALAIAKKAKS